MKKRRILMGVIAATGLFTLASCGGSSDSPKSSASSTTVVSSNKTESSSEGNTVKDGEIAFTASDAAGLKAEAKAACNAKVDESNVDKQDYTLEIGLAKVLDLIDKDTTTDLNTLKQNLNGYYESLWDLIVLVKNRNLDSYNQEAEFLYDSSIYFVNELNADYISYEYSLYLDGDIELPALREVVHYYYVTKLADNVAGPLSTAKESLWSLYKTIDAKINNEDIRLKVKELYAFTNAQISSILSLDDTESIQNLVKEFKFGVLLLGDDLIELELNEIKEFATTRLNIVVNDLLTHISNEEYRKVIQKFVSDELAKINAATTTSESTAAFKEVVADFEGFVSDFVADIKQKLTTLLDTTVEGALDKISDDEIRTDLNNFYTAEMKKINAITVSDVKNIGTLVSTIEGEIKDFVKEELNKELIRLKKAALAQLSSIINAGLDKLPNEELKTDLKAYWAIEEAKLEDVEDITEMPSVTQSVLEETEKYIKTLLVNTLKGYIARLTAVETATAYDYIPSAMTPMNAANIVNAADIAYDFSNDTSIANINQAGYGEQWQMVIENINQSVTMAKVFNVAQTVLSAAGNAVDIYITNSYSDEIEYTYNGEGFSVYFTFDGSSLLFNININKSVTVPGIGSVSPLITMSYDLAKETKVMYIKLSDNYITKYTISDSVYEMATHYGVTIAGQTASRSSWLSITKDSSDNVVGHIYEYTTLNGSDKIKACADFLIANGYTTVIGNKASGMIGFDGYISELYKADEGRLLGYEVQEEKTILGVTGTYNTLWFNMWDMNGITSVKVTDKSDANSSGRSTVDTYLNGSTSLLVPTYNTKLLKTSRKYDVELRSRFYYSYDSENGKYVSTEVKVPMFFIQEGSNYESFEADFKKDNGFEVSVGMSTTVLNKILSDYDTYIPVFKENKELMSSEVIDTYLGLISNSEEE